MTRNKCTITTMMASEGYKPFSRSAPNIYIRNPTSPHEDAIDWNSEPTELLEILEVQVNNIKTYPRVEIDSSGFGEDRAIDKFSE